MWSNIYIFPPAKEIFNREVEESFNIVKQMQADGKLTKEQQETFEGAQAAESDANILAQGIRKMTQCLIKGTGDEGVPPPPAPQVSKAPPAITEVTTPKAQPPVIIKPSRAPPAIIKTEASRAPAPAPRAKISTKEFFKDRR